MVKADLEAPSTLTTTFRGECAVFATTDVSDMVTTARHFLAQPGF
jgi:hypothetical protein